MAEHYSEYYSRASCGHNGERPEKSRMRNFIVRRAKPVFREKRLIGARFHTLAFH